MPTKCVANHSNCVIHPCHGSSSGLPGWLEELHHQQVQQCIEATQMTHRVTLTVNFMELYVFTPF